MRNPLLTAAVCLFLCTTGCGDATPGRSVEIYGRFSNEIVHLPSGDSLEYQARIPVRVPEGPGAVYMYYPFAPMDDTVRLKRIALDLFRSIRPGLDSASVAFVVMRAVDKRAADRVGVYEIKQYGVVVRRRAQGWSLLEDTVLIR
jgi:hypothetical protein